MRKSRKEKESLKDQLNPRDQLDLAGAEHQPEQSTGKSEPGLTSARNGSGQADELSQPKAAKSKRGRKKADQNVSAGQSDQTAESGKNESGKSATDKSGTDQKESEKKKKKKSRRLSNILLVLILLIGLGIMAYPSFSEYWNSLHQSRAIMGYAERVAEMTNEEYEYIWNAALKYNKDLLAMPNRWLIEQDDALLDAYEEQLNIEATGNMGFISIPKIDVNLPIYHGTSDAVLQTSIGHITGTSLPAGSAHSDEEDFLKPDFASHCVLSGHRGLPSARLFSDLDAMELGDLFYLTILDQTLTYEVDQIVVIEPEDLTEMEIIPGRDLCTLMTCTPYGINTHRLLVRGSRVENEKQRLNVRVTADALKIEPMYVAPFIAVPILIFMTLWVIIGTGHKGSKKRTSV